MSGTGPAPGAKALRPPSARWDPPGQGDPDRVRAFIGDLRLPATLCEILAVRGIASSDDAKRFLRPRLDHLADARTLADGEKAADRIARAIRRGERILVHGDYDVDGICSTALLTRWLRHLGAAVTPFVPHRLRDGYDFAGAGLAAASESGASLIVTADCGTVAHDSVAEASRRGIDVVVTDHHTVGGAMPDAFAVVNPQRPDCGYPDKGLCGAGLAYRVAELVGRAVGDDLESLPTYLDLVALATVADLVPLVGENRVLVHYGLRRFATTRNLGLAALLEVADVDGEAVSAGQLGFQIAPRINAAGRIGESADALRLLLSEDPAEVRRLATDLDATNGRRRDEDRRTLDEALSVLEREYEPERDYGVVLAGAGWHPGVIGIVASRIVERIHRPVVMVALGETTGRGSARSIPGFHLYEALRECAEHLDRFGGHRQAAGMDVKPERIDAFRRAFNQSARSRLTPEDLSPRLRLDLDVRLADIDSELVRWLRYLEPHGMGNPGPMLRARGVRVTQARVVGSNHLKVRLEDDGAELDGIGFGLADRCPPETILPEPYDVLFRAERNEWRGRVSAQAKLADLRPSSGGSA